MTKITTVLQTPAFKKAVKKLHKNQKLDLDYAIKELMKNPRSGEPKKGDLAFLRVYKFKMAKQLSLLGYFYEDDSLFIILGRRDALRFPALRGLIYPRELEFF